MTKQTDVLIIGGGFAGLGVAQTLSKQGVDVTLVDKKDYFEVTFAVLRNVAAPSTHKNSPRKRYMDFIGAGFVQGAVTTMNNKVAVLDTGERIEFKQAIIAPGSRYPTLPLAKSENALSYNSRAQEILKEHHKLAAASSVLVIGGGAVGVELAGEIASAFPHTGVTLAHSGDSLLAGQKPKAQSKALEQLRALGVKVELNSKFVKDGDSYRCTQSQRTLNVSLVYECIGMKPNTEFLIDQLPETLDGRGLVMVDSHMRVKGYDNLYSLGDCSNLDTVKHGYLASVQGSMLAKMLLKQHQGKTIKAYKTPPFAVITPTGTVTGVAQMPFGVTTAKFFVNFKQKDLGISNMFKVFGTKPNPVE